MSNWPDYIKRLQAEKKVVESFRRSGPATPCPVEFDPERLEAARQIIDILNARGISFGGEPGSLVWARWDRDVEWFDREFREMVEHYQHEIEHLRPVLGLRDSHMI